MTWYVIDGMDGSGKTTAGTMLKNYLESKGRSVLDITHPTEHRLVGRISDRFLHMEGGKFWELLAAIFFTLDVLASLFHKRRHSRKYDDIIFMRYSMAVAYVPVKLVPFTYRLIDFLLPSPDVRILIDIDPDVAYERILLRGESCELFETPSRLSKTREKMISISDGWHIIDNSHSNEDLMLRVQEIVSQHGGVS